jgi:hypothetical protein
VARLVIKGDWNFGAAGGGGLPIMTAGHLAKIKSIT